MASGSCFCGDCKYEVSGEPAMTAICHCQECHKLTGSCFSTCLMFPEDKFSIVTGSRPLKTFAKKHESGMMLSLHFCPNCATVLYKTADSEKMKGLVILQAGTLDNGLAINMEKPNAELWTKYRTSWLEEVTGSKQCNEFE
ncbi:Mss4-like protein [Lipomyces chichibuensis]|uniref:Mss4-like protein n=1 Tax=Lipomyces chichibuensis TaxID=1546026 RepID=UPI0033435F81